MRARAGFAALGLVALVCAAGLAGCDAAQPVNAAAGVPAGDPALQSAAERECARMTGNVPDELKAKPAETQALIRREYELCLKSVTDGAAPAGAARPSTSP